MIDEGTVRMVHDGMKLRNEEGDEEEEEEAIFSADPIDETGGESKSADHLPENQTWRNHDKNRNRIKRKSDRTIKTLPNTYSLQTSLKMIKH